MQNCKHLPLTDRQFNSRIILFCKHFYYFVFLLILFYFLFFVFFCRGELWCLLPNPNALVAVSKGMWAVKLCINKILQFLTGGAG